jgi:3-oxoadipate CoA-transferase beta subunit
MSSEYPTTRPELSRVYTDYAIFDVTADGFAVRELFGDNTLSGLRELVGLPLADATTSPSSGGEQ